MPTLIEDILASNREIELHVRGSAVVNNSRAIGGNVKKLTNIKGVYVCKTNAQLAGMTIMGLIMVMEEATRHLANVAEAYTAAARGIKGAPAKIVDLPNLPETAGPGLRSFCGQWEVKTLSPISEIVNVGELVMKKTVEIIRTTKVIGGDDKSIEQGLRALAQAARAAEMMRDWKQPIEWVEANPSLQSLAYALASKHCFPRIGFDLDRHDCTAPKWAMDLVMKFANAV